MSKTKHTFDSSYLTPTHPRMWKYGFLKYFWMDIIKYWKLFIVFWYEFRHNIIIGYGKNPTAFFTELSDTGKCNYFDGKFNVNGNYTEIKYKNMSDHRFDEHKERDYHFRMYPSIHHMGFVIEEIDENGYVSRKSSFSYEMIAKLMDMFPAGQDHYINDMWEVMKKTNGFTHPIKEAVDEFEKRNLA